MIADKIRILSSEAAIKYMEEDLMKAEEQIAELAAQKAVAPTNESINIGTIMSRVKYFLEHLDFLLSEQQNPLSRAAFFGVLFDKAPTYAEILSGTQNFGSGIALNEAFALKNFTNDNLVGGAGIEPASP